ncbi:hypothetical protein DBR42_04450 [Pelomonas sp. HMWF004]|nr:hypothetical protein DBR42_04450 [Pelomonas sp. HMWF004]
MPPIGWQVSDGVHMPSFYLASGEFVVKSEAQEGNKGISMHIEYFDFVPDPDGLVVLIQAVKCTKGKSLQALNSDYPSGGSGVRNDAIWTRDNWAIDAPGLNRLCPAFGTEFPSDASTAWNRWQGAKGNGNQGSDGAVGRVVKTLNALTFTPAMLDDRPSRTARTAGTAFHHQFEAVALRICKGFTLTAEVRGALTWGYKVTEAEVAVLTIDTPVATRRPSATWRAAATLWNSAKGVKSRIPGDATVWAA